MGRSIVEDRFRWVAAVERELKSEAPAISARILVATVIAVTAAAFAFHQYEGVRTHSDFGMVWFGARALSNHLDPYSVIGPGRMFDYEWPLIYPATALVAVLPFALLPEAVATAAFVGISTWLLAFGITRDGWYRLPLFITGAFITAAKLGQWSIVFTAALFIPQLALLSAVKPQGAVPILAASTTPRALWFAGVGLCVLLTASFLMDPHWIPNWIHAVRASSEMGPPIVRWGGPLLLLVLLRWRLPEAWLLLTLAILPQSWGWYNTLPVFTIPRTFAESVLLAATALIGAWYADNILVAGTLHELVSSVGTVIVWSIYLPAAALVLSRANNGPLPAWLGGSRTYRRTTRDSRLPSFLSRLF